MDDATRTKVKRYVINCGELVEHPDGSLYHANNYDALAQKLDDAERDRKEWKAQWQRTNSEYQRVSVALTKAQQRIEILEAPVPDNEVQRLNHEQLLHAFCRLAKQHQDQKMQVRALEADVARLREAPLAAVNADDVNWAVNALNEKLQQEVVRLREVAEDMYGLAAGLNEDDSWYGERRGANELLEKAKHALAGGI